MRPMVVNDMLRPRTMATGRYLPRSVDEATMAGSSGNTQGENMLMSPAPNAISGFTSIYVPPRRCVLLACVFNGAFHCVLVEDAHEYSGGSVLA